MTEKHDKKEKKDVEKAKETVGAYLIAAVFILAAIAAVTYFYEHSIVLRTVIYVGVAGGMGGVFYGIRGFIEHTSADDFEEKWKWWYFYHPITGFIYGILVYLLIVGGLFTVGSAAQIDFTKGVLLYCSISFLAGFAAKKFNEKLDELASTIFSTSSSTSAKTASTVASTLVVTDFPVKINAGDAGSVTVTAKDAKDKVVVNYTGTVKFTSSDKQATLPQDYTFKASDKGVHTFKNAVKFKTPGQQTITATDSQTASITGSQTGIEVD